MEFELRMVAIPVDLLYLYMRQRKPMLSQPRTASSAAATSLDPFDPP